MTQKNIDKKVEEALKELEKRTRGKDSSYVLSISKLIIARTAFIKSYPNLVKEEREYFSGLLEQMDRLFYLAYVATKDANPYQGMVGHGPRGR